MCGIVSLVYKNEEKNMGHEAAELLKRLEYRGYDSTGASFIDKDRNIVLVKRVGAPSKVCKELNIAGYSGQRFIGQVRWATYGAVTDINSQPHHVRCKVELVGAHNGNISNTDSLRDELGVRGHKIVSENDGEIIVHLVEDHYAANKAAPADPLAAMKRAYAASGLKDEVEDGVLLMIDAIRKAEAEAEGSYAAAVADPQLEGVFAMKSGSSLYAGIGSDACGAFVAVSSDLSSILTKTRLLIPLAEGEGLWYSHERYLVFSLKGEARFSAPKPRRSRLNVKDTALDPRWQYYMEQEIHSAAANMDELARYYFDEPAEAALGAIFEKASDTVKELIERVSELSSLTDDKALAAGIRAIAGSNELRALDAKIKDESAAKAALSSRSAYRSDEAPLLSELARLAPDTASDLALIDLAMIWRKRRSVRRYLRELADRMRECRKSGGAVYLLASGTSYHAALTASYFFGGLAGMPVYPCNPGQFRSSYMGCLSDADLVLAISQSGETKDLVDILQEIAVERPAIKRAALVNNENSRIPQELSDFYLPILCGPEIAVAATKSFINQLVILYILAASFTLSEAVLLSKVRAISTLITDTLRTASASIEAAARGLYLKPSIQLLGTGLIGLAREGALKIREVVLNHAEGYDAAEFKHGPNTILGKNTVFSLLDIEKAVGAALTAASALSSSEASPEALGRAFLKERPQLMDGLFSDYPLVFVCPPDERDIRVTISQIHTHKIRGASIMLFAEKNADLDLAVRGVPANNPGYRAQYVELPAAGDRFLFVFSAAAALQYLAFRMSDLKMHNLDELGIAEHGVHPDTPKNVSKSITVD